MRCFIYFDDGGIHEFPSISGTFFFFVQKPIENKNTTIRENIQKQRQKYQNKNKF